MITRTEYFDKQNRRWAALNAVYPVTFNKRLDLEFDSGNIYTYGASRLEPFTPIKITCGDSTGTAESFYFFGNSAQEWNASGVYGNAIRLVEPTKLLQGRFVDGLAVDQPISGEQKTLKEVVERVLAVTPLRKTQEETQEFTLTNDPNITAVLEGAVSPEYKWSSQTSLWEVLLDIGAYIGAIPRLTWTEDEMRFSTITFDFINAQKEKIKYLQYYGKMTNFDESQYCTQLESIVDNLAVKDEFESTIIYPNANGFITPRTNDLRLTDQNCEIILDKRIANLSRFLIDSEKFYATYTGKYGQHTYTLQLNLKTGKVSTEPDYEANIPMPTIDLTNYVKEYDEWQTQEFYPAAYEGGEKYAKNNTIYWRRYTNSIPILNTTYKTGVTGIFSTSVFRSLIESWMRDELPDFVPSTITARASEAAGAPTITFTFVGGDISSNDFDPRDYKFRVEYIPLDDGGKVRAQKANKNGYVDYIQPHNQRAEINDSVAYGANMQNTVNRMGVDYQTAPVICKTWGDTHDVGDYYKDGNDEYVVTNIKYTLTNAETVSCVYDLSKDWNLLSQFFNIDKKFRSWNIPAQSIERNLYMADNCVITASAPTDTSNTSSVTDLGIGAIADIFRTGQLEAYDPINACWIDRMSATRDLAFVSASAFGFGNSIKLLATTKNNVSAGVNIEKAEGANKYCRDVFYCNADGTMGEASFIFARTLNNNNPDKLPSGRVFPLLPYSNNPSNNLISFSAWVDKAPSEQLAINYQLFFTAASATTVVSDSIARNNSIVAFGVRRHDIKVYGVTQRMPKTITTMTAEYGDELSLANVTVDRPQGQNYFSISVGRISQDYIGWTIVVDDEIALTQYRGENEILPETLYFVFSHPTIA